MKSCETRGHSYFVAEVVGVESEGKVFVLVVCTACGEFRAHEAQVSRSKSPIRLLMEEKR